jgi:hypothetical protein
MGGGGGGRDAQQAGGQAMRTHTQAQEGLSLRHTPGTHQPPHPPTCFFSALKRTPLAMCSPHWLHQMLKGTSNLGRVGQGDTHSVSLAQWMDRGNPALRRACDCRRGGDGSCCRGCTQCSPPHRHTHDSATHRMMRTPSDSSLRALSRSACWPLNCGVRVCACVRVCSRGGWWCRQQQHEA